MVVGQFCTMDRDKKNYLDPLPVSHLWMPVTISLPISLERFLSNLFLWGIKFDDSILVNRNEAPFAKMRSRKIFANGAYYCIVY